MIHEVVLCGTHMIVILFCHVQNFLVYHSCVINIVVVSLTLMTSVRFYGLSPIAVLMVCGNALHFGDYSFCNIKNFSLGYSV